MARFGAVSRAVARRPKLALAVWALVIAASVVLSPELDKHLVGISDDAPGSDSSQARRIIAAQFSGRYNETLLVVFYHPTLRADDPAYSDLVNRTYDILANRSELHPPVSAFRPVANPALVSPDGAVTYIVAGFKTDDQDEAGRQMPAISQAISGVASPPFEVHATGGPAALADIQRISSEDAERAESYAIPMAIVVLLIILGGLLAALLPLALGVVAIVVMFALAAIIAPFSDFSVYIKNIGLMLGLGLGIDYSLLIVSRFKEELARERTRLQSALGEARAGLDALARDSPQRAQRAARIARLEGELAASPRTASVRSSATAGRAVLFSGATVALGFAALLAPEISLIRSIGLGGLLIVLTSVLAATTLLPALLVLIGPRVEWPLALSSRVTRLRSRGFWERAARRVLRRPKAYLSLVLALLIPLSLLSYNLTPILPGASSLPDEAASHRGLDLLAQGFGEGFNGPIVVLVQDPSGDIFSNASIDAVYALTRTLAARPDIARVDSITSLVAGANASTYKALYAGGRDGVLDPRLRAAVEYMVARGNDSTVLTVVLTYDSALPEAQKLVRELRSSVIPALPEARSVRVLVGGTPANAVDTNDATYSSFVLVVIVILAATYIVLLFLFRSVVLPLKTILENVVSVTASIGFLVLIFEVGVGTTLFGFKTYSGVTFAIPVIQFALLFGLSMDYQIFILSRIKEEYDTSKDNERAVAFGLEKTGGVVTSAALVMITVFGLFSTSNLIFLKELGLGLTFAVLVDATLVRTVAVPAGMKLLADRNWYLPKWLDRRLPFVTVEGPESAEGAKAPGARQP